MDAGRYICLSSNPLGRANSTIKIYGEYFPNLIDISVKLQMNLIGFFSHCRRRLYYYLFRYVNIEIKLTTTSTTTVPTTTTSTTTTTTMRPSTRRTTYPLTTTSTLPTTTSTEMDLEYITYNSLDLHVGVESYQHQLNNVHSNSTRLWRSFLLCWCVLVKLKFFNALPGG